MKRYKKLLVLLGVLLLVCGATVLVSRVEEKKENIRTAGETILAVDPETVDSLSWKFEETELSFHKEEDGSWVYDADAAFPVDEEKIAGMLETFRAFTAAFVIEDVEDYGQYGLTEPQCTVTFTAGEDRYTVKLGDYSKMDSQRYASLDDGRAYLMKEDPLETFQAELPEVVKNDEIPQFGKPRKVSVSGVDSYEFTRFEEENGKSYCAEDIYFTSDGRALDTGRVENYLSALENLNLGEYVTYNVTEESLKDYGLDAPELTLTVDYDKDSGEAATFTLALSRDPAEDDSSETFTAYLRIGESQLVYKLEKSDYKALMAASYNDLRHQELLSADFGCITQMDVVLDGERYSITSEGEGDGKTWYFGEQEIDISELRSAMANLTAEDFTEEAPTQKQEAALTVHLANETFPEVELGLYRYDGDNCIATLDGQPLCFIGRVYVVDLQEAINRIVMGSVNVEAE